MDERIVMGIDTSNYTTSVSLMTTGGHLLANIKRPLPVKPGERGLRQSDAVFAHVKNLPSAMEEARAVLSGRQPVCIGVSSRPRNTEGSYMPCFLAGASAAMSAGAALGIPVYEFSHQCGHIMAALFSSEMTELSDGHDFLAFHISGGTTELLTVHGSSSGFETRLLGGTADINAGQLIDRTGVLMGMPFPAGAHIEAAALEYTGKLPKRKIMLTDGRINLSGIENIAAKLYRDTGDARKVSAFVLEYVTDAIIALCDYGISVCGDLPKVFAGGVMSNSVIKSRLRARYGDTAHFAEPALSADNAVGIAALARRRYMKEF